jgi:tetratricopeptide (TPR) repeat protein
MNPTPTSPPFPPVAGRGGFWLAFVLAVAALAAEAGGLAASRHAALARAALEQGAPDTALAEASAALRWDPWQPTAFYARCVALKRLARWQQLAADADAGLRWHPDGYALELLLGEAAFTADRPKEAAQAFWRAFRHTPRPAHSPAQLWRMAMLAGRRAWGAADPRVAAAALRVLQLATDDPSLPPADRPVLRREALATLIAAGAPLTAHALAGAPQWPTGSTALTAPSPTGGNPLQQERGQRR